AGHGGGGGVDDEVLVRAEAAGGAGRGERERGRVERRVADGAAVEGERGGVVVVEVGGGVAGGDGVVEAEGRGAAAARVGDDGVGRARFERQQRCPGHRDGLGEGDLHRDHGAGF